MAKRKIEFSDKAFEQLAEWGKNDRKMPNKIFDLVLDIQRDPFEGKGKPKLLKHNLQGRWSRRITDEHRLIYKVLEDSIVILSCKSHYE